MSIGENILAKRCCNSPRTQTTAQEFLRGRNRGFCHELTTKDRSWGAPHHSSSAREELDLGVGFRSAPRG